MCLVTSKHPYNVCNLVRDIGIVTYEHKPSVRETWALRKLEFQLTLWVWKKFFVWQEKLLLPDNWTRLLWNPGKALMMGHDMAPIFILFFVFIFSPLNDSCNSEEFTFRHRAPTSPSREEVKAQAFERLQEELNKAQEVRNWLMLITAAID